MSFQIPQSVNYPSPLVPIHSNMQDEPKVRQQVPAEIDWGTAGFIVPGGGNCVAFNGTFQGYEDFEQFATLVVDNSLCDADVVFYFSDATMTITVPANTAYAVVPVMSNSLSFWVSSPNALVGDITRFLMVNYPVSPTTLEPTLETAVATSTGIVLAIPSTTQIIAAGISGRLQDLFVTATWGGNTAQGSNLTIQDGNGNILINQWTLDFPAAGFGVSDIIIDLSNLDWRFKNGLQAILTVSGGPAAGGLNIAANYIKP